MSSAEKSKNSGGHVAGRRAARRVHEHNTLRVDLPGLGPVTLPPPDQLAFVGGIAALAALQVIEWPVAVLLGAGHVLAASRGNKAIEDFGEALEDA